MCSDIFNKIGTGHVRETSTEQSCNASLNKSRLLWESWSITSLQVSCHHYYHDVHRLFTIFILYLHCKHDCMYVSTDSDPLPQIPGVRTRTFTSQQHGKLQTVQSLCKIDERSSPFPGIIWIEFQVLLWNRIRS